MVVKEIYQAQQITWWQDCPPATNFIAKIFNSLKLALIQKRKTSCRCKENQILTPSMQGLFIDKELLVQEQSPTLFL